ncbi:MAG: ribonuclease PH [Candidatus Eisenbacteria bacterium]|nr:ribonuclease PH [Candidatus Eisenbacteria bacterium]
MTASDAVPRADGRSAAQPRRIKIESAFLAHAEGSASVRVGRTWVICAATVLDRQPPFLRGSGSGWVTAEYGMLPRAVENRLPRGRPSGRTEEIQRLIGRSLRTVVELEGLATQTVLVDCDVIEADGGTRAAAITGGFVALCEACRWMVRQGRIRRIPVREQLAAISVGRVGPAWLSDLTHAEDAAAAVDINLVLTAAGEIVGLHADGERAPFASAALETIVELARRGLRRTFTAQRRALGLDPSAPFEGAKLMEAS